MHTMSTRSARSYPGPVNKSRAVVHRNLAECQLSGECRLGRSNGAARRPMGVLRLDYSGSRAPISSTGHTNPDAHQKRAHGPNSEHHANHQPKPWRLSVGPLDPIHVTVAVLSPLPSCRCRRRAAVLLLEHLPQPYEPRQLRY